jgi:exosortase D (VPLPA-CTERM-specific)
MSIEVTGSSIERGGEQFLRSAAAERSSQPGAPPSLMLVLVSLAALIVAFWSGLTELWHLWMTNPAYSHGPMIPMVSGFLLWKAWPNIRRAEWRDSWLAPCLLLLALLGWIVGELTALYIILHYSFVLALGALFLALTGWSGLKYGWPALVYLAFMIPLPPFLYNGLSSNLQLISTALGVIGIRAADVSVFVEGNVIDLGVYQLQVVEACSGLQYLFPLSSFGFLIAVLYRGPWWHRALIFVSTLPITVVMNSFRIAVIGVTVEHFGIEAAEGFLHAFEGWFIFVACVALLLGLIWLLNKLSKSPMSLWQRIDLAYLTPREMSVLPEGSRSRGKSLWVVCAMAVLAVPLSYAVGTREEQVPDRELFSAFPLLKGEWIGREDRLEDNILEALGLTDYIVANYRRSDDPMPVSFYTAFYNSQRTEAKIHSPRSCMPGGGWEIAELSQVDISEALGREGPTVNRVLIRLGNQQQLVYYWFQQRGRVFTNEYLAKWYLLWDGLTMARSDGALVRLVTPITQPAGEQAADARIQDFLAEFYDELPAYIPGGQG